jgi:hypothetical protein
MSDVKSLAIVPRTIDESASLAERLAQSSLLPEAMRGKAPDVLVTIMAGQELGFSPMAALRSIHVVEGKPVLAADGMVALVLGSGKAVYFDRISESDTSVTYETQRIGGKVRQCTWTIQMAKNAGLALKANWRAYPRAMLASRAKAELARDVYPDVLAGCYIDDEIQHERAPSPVIVQPADRAPANDDVVDAEIVENPAKEWIDKIRATDSEAACKALAKEIAASGLTNGAQAEVNDAYKARLAELRTKPVEAAS